MSPHLLGEFQIAVVLISSLAWIAKARAMGISTSTAYFLAVKVLFWGIIGSRVFHCLDYWTFYGETIWKIFDPTVGGLSLWGAFLAGTMALMFYGKGLKIGLQQLADAVVGPVAVGYLIGSMGWAITGTPVAGITDYPWGITIEVNMLSESADVIIGQIATVHPVAVYDLLWCCIVVSFLLLSSRAGFTPGMLFIKFVFGLALGRFFIGFVRVDPNHIGTLDMSQVVSILVLATSTFMALRLKRADSKRIGNPMERYDSIDSPRC